MLERLGFTNPVVWIAQRVFDQLTDALADLGISLLPIRVVLPRLRRKRQIHSSRLIFFRNTLPRLIASIESSSRFAFAGERSRCAVSCSDSYSARDNMTTA